MNQPVLCPGSRGLGAKGALRHKDLGCSEQVPATEYVCLSPLLPFSHKGLTDINEKGQTMKASLPLHVPPAAGAWTQVADGWWGWLGASAPARLGRA